MTLYRFLWPSLAAVAAIPVLLAIQATAQNPFNPAAGPPRVVEARDDGTLVERTVDGQIAQNFQVLQPAAGPQALPNRLEYRTEQFQAPDGSVQTRTVAVQASGRGGGGSFFGVAPDAESQKLIAQEQAAAQEARSLSAEIQGAEESQRGELKEKLREKLTAIFDLQQERRTREIAKIEERLTKLKDVLKKRDTAKDSIVDRRLEALTGGVDELGWEDSFPEVLTPGFSVPGRMPGGYVAPPAVPHNPYAAPLPAAPRASADPFAPSAPVPAPPAAAPAPPGAAPAAPVPVPPPVQPRR